MSVFRVHYLGVGSATPSLIHQPSCQVLEFRNRLFMIDCGEGAQLGMRRMKLKFSRLEHIFISHLHGDHFFGLPGLLSTMALHDIGGRVTVHIPREGAAWLQETMDMFCRQRSYELVIEPINPEGGIVFEDKSLTVTAFPLTHRVPCTGFLFRSREGLRHLRGDMVEWLEIPVRMRPLIKEGADYTTPDGKFFPNDRLTTPGEASVSYAYCSDTVFDPAVALFITPVDCLYHEATYLEADKAKAKERFHSTAAEAAEVAVVAGARKLVLGHYSKSYLNTDAHLREALSQAEAMGGRLEIIAATEGMTIEV